MGIDFDCLFKRNHSSNKLFIIFNGSRDAGQAPVFKRWSYYNYLESSLLNIDDPMCKINPKLTLGWYYGNENESYCDYIVDIVNEFAKQNDFKEVVFFASSGGGFAALYCACKIPNSMVIAINPQIKLSLYQYTRTFQSVTGIDLSSKDKFNRNDLGELIKCADETEFIFIENSASDVDMIQLNYLSKVLNNDYHYGLTQLRPNVLSWVYEGNIDLPHNAQEYFAMFFAIKFLSEHFCDAMNYSELFLIFTELWNDHYEQVNNYQKSFGQRKRKIECLLSASGSMAETMFFEKVYSKNNIVISAKNTPYNFCVVYNMLEPDSLYKFVVNDVSLLSGETEIFSILVKDTLTDTIDLIKNFRITDNDISILFVTGQETEKKELRIYSGEACKTNNISLKIGFCKLIKIANHLTNLQTKSSRPIKD